VQKAREDFGHSKHAQRTKQQEVLAGWKTTQLHGLNVKKTRSKRSFPDVSQPKTKSRNAFGNAWLSDI
jgi:hypothetical protein